MSLRRWFLNFMSAIVKEKNKYEDFACYMKTLPD
jgi:hypothetical protein